MTGIVDLPAIDIRRRIGAGEISPVEVVEASLARIKELNGAVNAVVTLNPRATDDARELERRTAGGEPMGLLWGLPAGIKDVTEVAGLRTTYGSSLYADHVPAEDALVVRRLREAGAIILGKTNTPEFAAGGNTWNEVFGRTRNPWDLSRSAGGSTGGGAAALATGMIALAEGTDLGGSLRIPASFCGVVGLRPSVGLVPTVPSGWPWDTLQVTGPMGRTAADVALMLRAVAGPDAQAPHGQPVGGRDFVGAALAGPAGPLRIAYCSDPVGIGIDSEVERVCREAAFGLADRGHQVEEIALDLAYGRPAFLALRGLWFVTHMYSRLDRTGDFGANVRNNIRMGLETTSESLGAAEQARSRIWHEFRRLFERWDQVLTPCMAIPPFPVEQNYPETVAGKVMETYVDWIAPTFVLSLTGLPVASVPCGVDPSGLPVGIQVVGRPRGEEAVLALAAAIQDSHAIDRPQLTARRSPPEIQPRSAPS